MKILRIFSRQSKKEHAMIIQDLAEASKRMDEIIIWFNSNDCPTNTKSANPQPQGKEKE